MALLRRPNSGLVGYAADLQRVLVRCLPCILCGTALLDAWLGHGIVCCVCSQQWLRPRPLVVVTRVCVVCMFIFCFYCLTAHATSAWATVVQYSYRIRELQIAPSPPVTVPRCWRRVKKAEGKSSYPGLTDPGVVSVTRIFHYYKKHG